VCTADKFFF